MNRIICLPVLLCCVGILAFGQPVPAQKLEALDIEAFLENYDAIESSMATLDYDLGNVLAGVEGPQEMLDHFRNNETPKEIQDIMSANGLGSDGLEKMTIIIISAYGFHIEDMFLSKGIDLDDISGHEYSSELKEFRDEIAAVRGLVHPEDLELIRGRAAEIMQVVEG